MSKETMQWLNTMQLIGFADKRGNAWHYREEFQGDEPNHYAGAIPAEDIIRRLFNFTVEEMPLCVMLPDGTPQLLSDRKAMVTSDTFEVMGLFKDGYQGHDYEEWLLRTLCNLIDDEVGIGSAGLLKNRAVAYVQIEVPDSIETPEGVTFRPNLLATTSFDGSIATTFKRTATIVVCDNTREMALSGDGEAYKVKHTKNSGIKLATAREALGLIHSVGEEFAAEVASLCALQVSKGQFDKVIETLIPMPDDGNKRGTTVADDKRTRIRSLYEHDDRCTPWQGTAFGVVQAFNTYAHHYAGVRGGVHRAQRNMENVVNGKLGNLDNEVITVLTEMNA